MDYPYYYRASTHDIGSISPAPQRRHRQPVAAGLDAGPDGGVHARGQDGGVVLPGRPAASRPRASAGEHRQQLRRRLSMDADCQLALPAGRPTRAIARPASTCFHPLGDGQPRPLALGQEQLRVSKEQSADLGYRFGSLPPRPASAAPPASTCGSPPGRSLAQRGCIDPITGEPMTFDTTRGAELLPGLRPRAGFRPRQLRARRSSRGLSTGYTSAAPASRAAYASRTRWTLDRQLRNTRRAMLTWNYSTGPRRLQVGPARHRPEAVT